MATTPHTRLSEQEYLQIERRAEFRSEFFNGEMFAMAGATLQHSRLQANILTELSTRLRERGCEAFGSDLRVRVSAKLYTYPDVTVVCGRPSLADDLQDSLENPVAIFEILSRSTAEYDRGPKFQHYRTLASLRDYILVDQYQVRVEQFTRHSDSVWMLRDYHDLNEELAIDSIGVSIPLGRIYDRIEFPAEQENLNDLSARG